MDTLIDSCILFEDVFIASAAYVQTSFSSFIVLFVASAFEIVVPTAVSLINKSLLITVSFLRSLVKGNFSSRVPR